MTMRNIKLTLAIFFGGIFALWLLATSFPDQWGVYPVRNLLLQLTGAISILAMSACLILAVRPKILETPLGGLDKMYRLHKWFGIIALFRQHPPLGYQAIPQMAGRARSV